MSKIKHDQGQEVSEIGESVQSKNTNKNIDPKIKTEKVEIDLEKIDHLFPILIDLEKNSKDISEIRNLISSQLKKIIQRHSVTKEYLVLFLYDTERPISQGMADKIYDAIPEGNGKPILLIIHSSGGRIEPAYLISKACKEHSPKFIVSIPRKAKSAATLISFGGDEIHMGSMSELGPIDPQFGGLPALGLNSALDSIAKVVTKHPDSSIMFSSFLQAKLDLRILGYFERVSESAKQYAIRLLKDKETPKSTEEIANTFVYDYKDHSFVVDKDEAKLFLGENIKVNSEEYKFSNDVHKFLNRLNLWAGYLNFKVTGVVGSFEDLVFNKKDEE